MPQGQKQLIWIWYGVLTLVAVWAGFRLGGYVHDDTFITLRYARNLAETGVLSWNIGEAPVEGYTSPFHVLLNAFGISLGLEPLVSTRLFNVIGLIIAVGAMALSFHVLRLPQGARLAGFATLLAPPLIAWAWGGLEGAIVVSFVALGLLGAVRAMEQTGGLRAALLSSLAFGLAYLTRPEMALANFAAGLGVLAFAPLAFTERLKRFVAIGAVSLCIVAAHLVWRQATYDEWVPLTYHAKVGLETSVRLQNGLDYVLRSAKEVPLLVLAFLAAVVVGRRSPAAKLGLMVLAVQGVVVLWLGGDHMPYARMLLPMLPAAALATAAAIGQLPVRVGGTAGGLAVMLLAVTVNFTHPGLPDPAARLGSVVGAHLARTLPEPRTIALATAGSIPFYAGHHTYIDTLGLNDPVIARREDVPIRAYWQAYPGHGKGDGAYVLRRAPDVIILGGAEGALVSEAESWFLTDVELSELSGFYDCYEEVVERIDTQTLDVWSAESFPEGLIFTAYHRRC